MAVLVEAISVIVRRDAIAKYFPRGWEGFVNEVPNTSLCFDEDIARVGFMEPESVREFVEMLESTGLRYLSGGFAMEIAVLDQFTGPLSKVNWLEFGHLNLEKGKRVAACWLFEGARVAAGIHMKGLSMSLALPPGWRYESSLSASTKFVPNEELDTRLKFLRNDDGVEVYEDLETGEEVFVASRRS